MPPMLVLMTRFLHVALLAFTLTGCATKFTSKSQLAISEKSNKVIAVFLDGTHNDEASDTNVKRLHSLVSLQGKTEMATLYIEGVGVGKDFFGMTLGIGFEARVERAYEFLLENYNAGDKIYIFGFSRGAYGARALASLLFHAGLPPTEGRDRAKFAKKIYRLVHAAKAPAGKPRRDEVQDGLQEQCPVQCLMVPVEVLGLWDSVQALGNPHWERHLLHKSGVTPMPVDIDVPNQHQGDQLCNVRRAYHALSIDDDREWLFTPLLLGRKALFANCPQSEDDLYLRDKQGLIQPGRLQEVWFSGAHSDVGGGYADGAISGVSLNWMIGQVPELVPPGAAVPQDPFGTTHDPESGKFSITYHAISRNIGAYVSDRDRHRAEFADVLCIHPTVLQRRNLIDPNANENHQLLLRRDAPVCLIDDHREGFSNPQRLRERPPGDDTVCVRNIDVQVWPLCKGIMP